MQDILIIPVPVIQQVVILPFIHICFIGITGAIIEMEMVIGFLFQDHSAQSKNCLNGQHFLESTEEFPWECKESNAQIPHHLLYGLHSYQNKNTICTFSTSLPSLLPHHCCYLAILPLHL